MLSQQQRFPFSTYSNLYDPVIPRDSLLMKINELTDFPFVYKELSDKYSRDNGRVATRPVRMFKYLLLKTVCRISDVVCRLRQGCYKEGAKRITCKSVCVSKKKKYRFDLSAAFPLPWVDHLQNMCL